MPKLTILTACERVIIDRQASLPTLVNIFQRMNVQVDQDQPLPANAIAPQRWAVFALWVHTPEERDIEYVQHTQILAPAGDLFVEGSTKFKVTEADDLQSKNHMDVLGMPIATEGFIRIRIWLEDIADTTGEYQFAVRHIPKDQQVEQQPTVK
jgi:hypothetical protein